MPLFFTAPLGKLDFVEDWLRWLDRSFRLDDFRFLDLNKGALFANFNLDRASLAGRVGLLDLGRLFAGQRDLLFFFFMAVRFLQISQ